MSLRMMNQNFRIETDVDDVDNRSEVNQMIGVYQGWQGGGSPDNTD